MAVTRKRRRGRPPFDCIALLLQGGGALGAYQAGIYEALHEAEIEPDWIGGISIGAINAALIAGNAPEHRVDRLRAFWEGVTTEGPQDWAQAAWPELLSGDAPRALFGRLGSLHSLLAGQPGFFKPRLPPPLLHLPGSLEATSFYDTGELRSTLERLVDFDRIEGGPVRLSVGAVNVRSGNFVYFDSTRQRIGPEHIMASGSLPPGFPATEIEGELYWDGGLISNTPLQWVIDAHPRQDTLAFQVDLWSARGEFPADLFEVMQREKEIRYSSRTRLNTDYVRTLQRVRRAAARLLDKLPPELAHDPDLAVLTGLASETVLNIVHLIYRTKSYEDQSKDYEFSRTRMREHWQAGYHDACRTLRHEAIYERPTGSECVRTFDVTDSDNA